MKKNITDKQKANLVHIKKGQRLAAKPEAEKKTEYIPLRITKKQKDSLQAEAEVARLNLTAYIRGKLGL